jgi:hypothetical protein
VRTRSSIAILVAANLLPLLGVVFWGWSLQEVLALYWSESAVVGVLTLVRMAAIGGLGGLPMYVFFVFHYGMFMGAHALFLVLFFWSDVPDFRFFAPILETFNAIWPMLLALFVSHALSYVIHVVHGGEPLRRERETEEASIGREMARPYGRIVAMHVAIVLGAGIVMVTGEGVVVLAILIAVKIAADVYGHRREHRKGAVEAQSG